MAMTSNAGNFFQTDATHAKNSLRKEKAKNIFGNPLAFKTKLLSLTIDPSAPFTSVFVTESSGKVRKVNIASNSVTKTYSGPTAPATCVAATKERVAAGSWDKVIYQWDSASGKPLKQLKGHSDFLKTIIYTKIAGKTIIVSGGSDKKIIVWDAESGKQLYSIIDTAVAMGAIQHLAVDPHTVTPDNTSVTIVSSSSDPHIRRWKLTLTGGEKIPESFHGAEGSKERLTILEHETIVYKVVFSSDEEGDLWTASGDKTVKCLARGKSFTVDDTIDHGEQVRAVAITEQYIVTAGRDEDVKLWDRSSGKLIYELYGHFDEVVDLAVVIDAKDMKEQIVSVGLDATLRTWKVDGELRGLVEEMRKVKEGIRVVEVKEGETGLTAEEEAELTALMEDSD